VKEKIIFLLGTILFIKETYSTLLKIEKFFSSYSIAKYYLVLVL